MRLNPSSAGLEKGSVSAFPGDFRAALLPVHQQHFSRTTGGRRTCNQARSHFSKLLSSKVMISSVLLYVDFYFLVISFM